MQQGLVVALAGTGRRLRAGGRRRAAIAGVLYGVSAADPVSWLAAAAVLLGASALANLVPAWRAARVDPCEALRTE